MTLDEFYGKVLPGTGQYILFQNKAHSFYDSIESLTAATLKRIDTDGLYFATASFNGEKNRRQDNVKLLRAYRIDIDAGEEKYAKHGDAVYETQKDALRAVVEFAKTTDLYPTLIVSSGGGLHVYWCLSEDVTPDVWYPIAKSFNRLCLSNGLRVDSVVTADTARVLRPIGSPHKSGKRVDIIKDTGRVYSQEAFAATVKSLVKDETPEFAPSYKPTRSLNDDILGGVEGPPASIERVANNCSAVAEMRDKQGCIQEPHWRAVIGIAKYCADGETLVHEWGKGYDGYSYNETQQKLDLWTKPPTTCEHFSTLHPGCATCPHKGKITTPKQVGYIPKDESKPEPEVEIEDGTVTSFAASEAATDDCPVPDRPDLFDPSNRFYYRHKDAKWTLMHKFKKVTKDAIGNKVENEFVKPVVHRLIWCESTSDIGGASDNGVAVQFGMLTKPGAVIHRVIDMPASTMGGGDTLEKFMMAQGIYTDPGNTEARVHLLQFIKQEVIRKQNDMRFVIRERFGYHFHEGQMLCSQGQHTFYPGGEIRKTTYNTKLRQVGETLCLASLPEQRDGIWQPSVWREHVIPAAADYVAFIRSHYGHKGYENPRLALAIALASPYLVFTADAAFHNQRDLPNVGFVVSLYSRGSGIGKSSLQEVVAAAFGKPAMKRAGKKTMMTVNAAAALAKEQAIYPIILDEVTQNDGKEAAQLVDSFGNGGDKLRMTQNQALAEGSKTFAAVTLMSTNVPQRELLLDHQKNSDALQMRLLELDFDGIHPVGDSGSFRTGLKEISMACGAWGAVATRMAVDRGPREMAALAEQCVAEAFELLKVPQSFRFFARGLAIILMSHRLMRGLFPFDIDELIETYRANIMATQHYVQAQKEDAPAQLSTMLNAMSPHIVVTQSWSKGEGKVDLVLNVNWRGPMQGREVRSEGVVHVLEKAVTKWCIDNQLSKRRFLGDLKDLGLLLNMGTKRLTTGMNGSADIRGNCFTFRLQRSAEGTGDNVVDLETARIERAVDDLGTMARTPE